MNDRYGLIMLEYEKLRDESIQALQAQQAILQWSIASFGAILGAALLLATQNPLVALPLPVSFGIFGVGIPAFAAMCCLAWFGELVRMERIGVYIRGIEFEVAQAMKYRTDPNDRSAPLRWETWIAFAGKRAIAVTKQKVGYFGSLGIYGLVFVAALATALWNVWFVNAGGREIIVAQILTAIACGELLMFLMVILYLVRGLTKAANTAPHLDKVDPTTVGFRLI